MMIKSDVLEFCEGLIDNVTIIKGFLELSTEKDSPYIVEARKELDKLTKSLVTFIEQKIM